MEASQGARPSYLDHGKEDEDPLNKSWDVEGRYRLQENALKLRSEQSEKGGDAAEGLFRVQVELGLHELTAALSSLR